MDVVKRLLAIGLVAASLILSVSACGSNVTSPTEFKTLSGVVYGPAANGNEPLNGIRITATFTSGSTSEQSAISDANGSYRFAFVPQSATRAHIEVRAAGYDMYSTDITVAGDTRADIQLAPCSESDSACISEVTPPTAFLTLSGFVSTGGTVVGQGPPVGGVPVEGVRVVVQQGDLLVTATTDQSGFFTVSGLQIGDVHIGYSKDGYLSGSSNLTMNGNIRTYRLLFPGRDIPPTDIFLNVTLSGVVFEETPTGRRPIPHVSVYCEPCGVDTHTFATTDDSGFYSFSGVWTDAGHSPTRIYISLDGYTDPGGLPQPTPPNPSGPGWREVVVNGDTRFDIQLVPR